MAGLLICESSSSQQKAGNVALCRKSANFRFRLLQVQLPSLKKVFFVHAKKENCTCRCCYSKIKRSETSKGKTREDFMQPAVTMFFFEMKILNAWVPHSNF